MTVDVAGGRNGELDLRLGRAGVGAQIELERRPAVAVDVHRAAHGIPVDAHGERDGRAAGGGQSPPVGPYGYCRDQAPPLTGARSASFELDRIQESWKLSRVFELTVHLPEAVVRPQNGSKIMQSIVELNTEETKMVVVGVRAIS